MAIPKELTKLNQWAVALADKKEPYDAKTLKLASVNDPTTWSSYEEALACINDPNNNMKYLSFVLSEDDGLVGIDIDAGFDEYGLLTEYACDVINSIGSYTEYSKRKRGVHIFVKGKLPIKTGMFAYDKRYSGEIYQSGKQLIMTGDTLIDEPIRENQEGIDYVLQTYFQEGFKTKGIYKEPLYKMEYQAPHDGHIPLSGSYPDIYEGSRNLSLLSYGGHLLNQGYTAEQILPELLKLNKTKCKPPLSRKEVEAITKSVVKYIKDK